MAHPPGHDRPPLTATRTLVVACPDWPLTALDVDPDEPALVLGAGRVVAATGPARAVGVERGQRQREAQFLCPEVRVLARDESREARRFEAVASALGAVTPWVEVRRPGRCSFGVRGPVRLFGGEGALVRHTAEVVAVAVRGVGVGRHPGCRIGVADGAFAAGLAAPAAWLKMVGCRSDFQDASLVPGCKSHIQDASLVPGCKSHIQDGTDGRTERIPSLESKS